MERETLKLALDALGKAKRQIVHAKVAPHECIGEAITAIKEALAQPAQEPVAVVAVNQSGGIRMEYQDGSAFDISKHVGQRFYTTPPQRTLVDLTDDEWFEWWRVSPIADETEAEIDFADFVIIAQAVSAKLKEDNNGT